jgi:membrane protease YdiL (CAAX protease family)
VAWRLALKKVSLTFSIVLIVVFLVLNSVGTVLSAAAGFVYLWQILLLLPFSVFLFLYAGKKRLRTTLGLTRISQHDFRASLYYIPLGVLVLANGAFFFDRTIPVLDIFLVILFMACIAFCEEFLFRGVLFKAIEERGSTKTAVIISGVTFGLGHIINLLNGYSGMNQMIQIIIAVLIGLVLSVLFVRTKSIVPGIIFHFIFNISSALSMDVEPLQNNIMVGIIIAVSSVYLAYLVYLLKKDSLKRVYDE